MRRVHGSLTSALQRAHTERQRGKRALYAGTLRQHRRPHLKLVPLCMTADLKAWIWTRIVVILDDARNNFTLNHGLLQTAPPCDTLRTDTGILPHRTVIHLLTDFSATAV
ncbi:hypothetical protein QQF64_017193 [Cirrhinus molitorella]|uniref:Uncharacterized protein n=1 Tax=Cirrhinus molitorella TaxID=172907 RepID=A0ABR3LI24_9TELE